MSLAGCSAPSRDMAIVKCFDELTAAGKVPAAKDVKLDLKVQDEAGGFVVSGVAYATTFSGDLTPLRVNCHVGVTGTVKTATAELDQ